LVKFLGTEQVQLPVGGAPAGFTALWNAAVRFKFMTEDDPREFTDDIPKPDTFRALGSWFHCYYKDSAAALKAARALNQEFAPSQFWYFEAPLDTVMLPEEVLANFQGPSLSMECQVKTLRSGKYRHEFHLIALPAAVAAYAEMSGYINYEFDISELTDRELAVTDEFAARMIGGEYAGNTIPYTESTLWKRRTQLWADLGEPDPRAYNPIGSARFATTSAKLSECLGIASTNWANPVWARVAMVQDPRVDAVAGSSGNRLTRPALLHIYEDEAEAREDAGRTEESAPTTPVDNPRPPLPEQWRGMEDDWVAALQEFKAKLGPIPLPVARARVPQMDVEGAIAATADEALAWWGYV
jgi:hypothetical protein